MLKTSLKPTGTDWNRVKREAATDAPIDDQTGPGWRTRINAVLHDAVAHGVVHIEPDTTAQA